MNTRPLNPPFLMRAYPDLVGEMGLDQLFLTRPGSPKEAEEIGFLYPHAFDKTDPLGSIEQILSRYKGPGERYVFITAFRAEGHDPVNVVLEKCKVRRPIEKEGIYDYFFNQVVRFLVASGIPEETVRTNLGPARSVPGSLGTWVIGYERQTGHTTVIDCSGGYEIVHAFLGGENNIPVLRLPATKEPR